MKVPLSSLWAEFKEFAFKGNMIELAVAVIMGAAFGNVIHSLVNDVIMPTVVYVIHTGEEAAHKAKDATVALAAKTGIATSQPTTAATTQPGDVVAAVTPPAAPVAPVVTPAPAVAAPADDPTKPVNIDFKVGPVPIGKFLGELINFIIVAFAVFVMVVKVMGGVMKRMNKPPKPGEPTTRECPECLSIIPIKAKRCSHCTAVIVPAVV